MTTKTETTEQSKPVKNDEIVHTCRACRKTIKKGEPAVVLFPVVVTPNGNKVAQLMVCKYCGVVTALPEGSVEPPKVEQPKIIIPH